MVVRRFVLLAMSLCLVVVIGSTARESAVCPGGYEESRHAAKG